MPWVNVNSSADDVSLLAVLFFSFQFSPSNYAVLQGEHCINIPLLFITVFTRQTCTEIPQTSYFLHILDNFMQSIQLEPFNRIQ